MGKGITILRLSSDIRLFCWSDENILELIGGYDGVKWR